MTQTDSHSGGNEARKQPDLRNQQGQSTVLAEVPEHPKLASNVRLVGEMRDTGFKDRQWLIQRGDQFIQLTELLYQVAEQANGERSLEEMAARVTELTDWVVSADNIRLIVQTKLIPMGLIAAADGSFVSHAEDRGGSPLRLNMRTRMIGPDLINPITKVLQILYVPSVLIPTLALIVLAHTWLYLVHGIANSVYDLIYMPGLLPVVLAVMLVAGIFHEFGHASALRYGGGVARGMGMGLYIVYPAFYTDTTDSYRLGRWARVRTDLGGFYFHLIFALGIMALYLASGQGFLLLIVLLINLDIIRQCLPFVRFDGYWALADLTGIPDFFSQMGAFLRSVLPLRRWKGNKLPNLKPWVKAVFAAYMIVTIAVLSLLLFRLVTYLPSIMATIWDSSLVQAGVFANAQSNGDFLVMAVAASHILLLGLQVLGISYLLYALGRMLLVALWKRIGLARRRGDHHRAPEPVRIFREGP